MNTPEIPNPHELKNKPLVEAIFELRWKLPQGESGLPQDPGFRIALGRFYDRVRTEYPEVVNLPTAQVPEDMTAYAVRHQFRAVKDGWPVTQLGPGILTVNETAGYSWKTFRPRVCSAIRAIFEAYPKEAFSFSPVLVQLRYLDAIHFNPQEYDPVRFLADFLHTRIEVDRCLFRDSTAPTAPAGLNLNLVFKLPCPRGVGKLGFAVGEHNGEPSIIMEITIRSDAADTPQAPDGFHAWLQDAHTIAVDQWFFTLCRGQLMERFDGRNQDKNG